MVAPMEAEIVVLVDASKSLDLSCTIVWSNVFGIKINADIYCEASEVIRVVGVDHR
jgi:hypothetical protein